MNGLKAGRLRPALTVRRTSFKTSKFEVLEQTKLVYRKRLKRLPIALPDDYIGKIGRSLDAIDLTKRRGLNDFTPFVPNPKKIKAMESLAIKRNEDKIAYLFQHTPCPPGMEHPGRKPTNCSKADADCVALPQLVPPQVGINKLDHFPMPAARNPNSIREPLSRGTSHGLGDEPMSTSGVSDMGIRIIISRTRELNGPAHSAYSSRNASVRSPWSVSSNAEDFSVTVKPAVGHVRSRGQAMLRQTPISFSQQGSQGGDIKVVPWRPTQDRDDNPLNRISPVYFESWGGRRIKKKKQRLSLAGGQISRKEVKTHGR